MKQFVGKHLTEKVSFMDGEVEVKKLSIHEVRELQKVIQKASKSKSDDSQIKLLLEVVRFSVVGAEELTDDEMEGFPITELVKLSDEILKIVGISADRPKDNPGN